MFYSLGIKQRTYAELRRRNVQAQREMLGRIRRPNQPLVCKLGTWRRHRCRGLSSLPSQPILGKLAELLSWTPLVSSDCMVFAKAYSSSVRSHPARARHTWPWKSMHGAHVFLRQALSTQTYLLTPYFILWSYGLVRVKLNNCLSSKIINTILVIHRVQ